MHKESCAKRAETNWCVLVPQNDHMQEGSVECTCNLSMGGLPLCRVARTAVPSRRPEGDFETTEQKNAHPSENVIRSNGRETERAFKNGISVEFDPEAKGTQMYRRWRNTRYRVQAVPNDSRIWMLKGVVVFLGFTELVLSIPVVSLVIRLMLVMLYQILQFALQCSGGFSS